MSWVFPVVLIGAGVALWLIRSSSNDVTKPSVLSEIVNKGAAAGFNVVLITMDTTRPEFLGCYGREQADTPNIDSLLDHGVRFDDAVTSVSTTLASHATIMTGLYPPSTGVRDNGIYKLARKFVTLAETLQGHGYDTGAFVSSFVLDSRFGLDQGFDTYEFKTDRNIHRGPASLEHERRANDVTASAIDWLRDHSKAEESRPYFLWVHYFDPHAPYDPPLKPSRGSKMTAYDAEIAFVDREFGRILKTIDKQGTRDKTLFVLVSDHGEGLGDHKENLHGIFIYESTTRAALIISNPKLFAESSRVDDRVVGTVDLMPTLCDLLGAPPPGGLDGISLLASDVPADRAIYMETLYPLNLSCSPLRGIRNHTSKFILAPQPEFYDLSNDPEELNNLFSRGGTAMDALRGQLVDQLEKWPNDGHADIAAHALSQEDRKRLSALGYVSGSSPEDDDSLPDPKERIQQVNAMSEVVRLLTESEFEDALALSREMIVDAGDWTTPTLMAAEALMHLDRHRERVDVLEAYCQRNPTSEMLFYLAHALLKTRDYTECARKLDQAEKLDPVFGAIPALRGDLYMARSQYADAIAEYEKAIEIDPDRVDESVFDSLQLAKKLNSRANP